uniref:Glycerol-3-phosphate acyltransferase 2, mitochondrial n=1 Tax=Leptobrachium leishanense TaxID=445787 RepID=A0A8C5MBI5_9ANUR
MMEIKSPIPQRSTKAMTTTRIWSSGVGIKIETIAPFQGNYRPLVGQPCQICTPKSMETFFYKRYNRMAFRNALHITEEDTRFRGWLVRRLSCFLFVLESPLDKDLSADLPVKIFKHPGVQLAITQDLAMEDHLNHTKPTSIQSSCNSKYRMEIGRILGQIHKFLSPSLFRFSHWLVLKLLRALFLNLQFHCGQVATVREASKACPECPVVFLCTHPSWLDSLLLPFLLFSQNLKVPRVAWDLADCSLFLRALLQRLGVVFLPTDQGPLSNAVLSAYVGTLLAEGHSLLIFLESPASHGSRSLSAVGCEWVRHVFRALQSKIVPDILIVPVGISYDCRPEDGVFGGKTLLSGICRDFLCVLCPWFTTLGCIRVDFAQPISFQEYIFSYQWRRMAPPPSLKETLLPFILGYRYKMYDESALEMVSCTVVDQEQAFVDGFILHSLRAAVSCSAIMPSHIMAALVLHRYRDGVSISRLLTDFSLLTEDILLHGFDVGFSGQRWDLVRHSLQVLRRSVSLYCTPTNDTYVLSRGSRDSVLSLGHHSAALLPVLLHEAIGACALHALLCQLPALGLAEIYLGHDELLDKLLCLCILLPRTFLLQPPCRSPVIMCQEILDKLIQCGLLVAHEDPSAPPVCDIGRNPFADVLKWKVIDEFNDSDSDHEEEGVKRYYKIGHSGCNADLFIFLCHLLNPVLMIYGRAALFLEEYEVCGQDTVTGYVNMLHLYLQRKAKEDGSFESTEYSLVVCAVMTFIDLGVFEFVPGSAEQTLRVSETFKRQENRKKLCSFIQQFVQKV